MGKTSGRTQKYVRLFSRGSLFSGEMDGRRTHKSNRSQKKSKWPAVTIQRMDPNLQPEVFRKTLLKKYITEYYSQRDLGKHPFQSYHFTDKKEKEMKKDKAL